MTATISSTIFIKTRDLRIFGDAGRRCFSQQVVEDLCRKIAKAALVRIEEVVPGEDGETAICAYIATSPVPVPQPVKREGELIGFVPLEVTTNAAEIFDDKFRVEAELRNVKRENENLRKMVARAERALGVKIMGGLS